MNERHAGGRPATGTGGHHITIAANAHRSWQLCIGKELWRQLSCPERVAVTTRGLTLVIEPTDDEGDGTWAVNGGSDGTIPRVSIGRGVAQSLGLVPGHWTPTRVEPGAIVVVMH